MHQYDPNINSHCPIHGANEAKRISLHTELGSKHAAVIDTIVAIGSKYRTLACGSLDVAKPL